MGAQSDSVINTIEGLIESGDLNPGDVIQEDALMAQLDISRTPMREALLELEAHGLIQRQPRKGAVIYKPTLEEFLCILEVHAHLEGQAAQLAARRLSRDLGARLEKAVADCAAHQARHGDKEPRAYYALNLEFHRVVAESACNPFLLGLVKSNARKLMAYYRARYSYPDVIADSVRDHQHIAALILDRDANGAYDAMAQHVQFDQVTAMDLLAAVG